MEQHERLVMARKRAGYENGTDAARAFGWNEITYRAHESGGRGLKRTVATRYAKAFRVSAAWLLTGEGQFPLTTIPIVGIAGANADGGITYEAGDLGEAPTIPSGNERTVAVEVRGDSLRGRVEDGWLVYYDDRREPITDDMIGELCVVELEDGRTLIKTPHYGRGKGLFDLESTNAPTMRDVPVRSAAIVTAIVPRRARGLIRRRA